MTAAAPALAGRLADRLAELAGRPPDGVWAAPGRVNLIGEHTDYNDGFVLPVAVDRAALVAVARRRDGRARCWSVQEGPAAEADLAEVGPVGPPAGWTAYPLGVAWALRAAGADVPGFDLLVDSGVPSGAGLSSSAALEAAVALALAELAGGQLSRTELAVACRRAENEVVGAPTGIMDQMAALCARAGHALFLDCRSLAMEHVPLGVGGDRPGLLVVDPGAGHAHRDGGGGYADRRAACERVAAALGVAALRDADLAGLDRDRARLAEADYRRARHVLSENGRVLRCVALLRAGDLAAAGAELVASHASLRDDFEVSTPELDLAVEAALTAGAWGARLTGGGFGGAAVALCPDPDRDAVAAGIRAAFAARGRPAPAVFAVRSSGGARRVA